MSRRVQFASPLTLDHAIELMGGVGPGAALIAGGQELMPALNLGEFEPTVLIDISRLSELRGIEMEADGTVSIGALSVHREIERSDLLARAVPLLAHSVAQIGGGWQVRNRGTIGGNIVAMHPLYDVLPPLLALDARVEIRDARGTRIVGIADMIADTRHGLGASAILVRVLIPPCAGGTGWGYSKLKATDGAYATASAAALVTVGADGVPECVRLVVGAVEELPRDLSAVAQPIVARATAEVPAALREAVETAITRPLDDQRGGADYRRAMGGVVAVRAIADALGRAGAAKQGGRHERVA